MPMFMKKPIAIEARHFTLETVEDVADWCGGAVNKRDDSSVSSMTIYTLEGPMMAQLNDWIIKGVRGEFYPCREEIFYETYEEVNE